MKRTSGLLAVCFALLLLGAPPAPAGDVCEDCYCYLTFDGWWTGANGTFCGEPVERCGGVECHILGSQCPAGKQCVAIPAGGFHQVTTACVTPGPPDCLACEVVDFTDASHCDDRAPDGTFFPVFCESPEGACCSNGPGTDSPCIITNRTDCEAGGGLFLGGDCISDLECEALFVMLDSMSATATPEGVVIRWTTATEIDTVGFRVLRENPNGREKKLEAISEVIPAAGNSITGASYQFLDNARQALSATQYFIEDVDVYGKVTQHGPILVEQAQRRTTGRSGR